MERREAEHTLILTDRTSQTRQHPPTSTVSLRNTSTSHIRHLRSITRITTHHTTMSDTLQSEPVPRSAASLDDTSTRRHYPPMVLQPNPYSGRLLSFDPLPHRASIYFFEFTHENPNAEYVWHIMPGFSQMRASSYMHVYDDNEDPNNRNRSRAPIVLRDAHSYET
jgi:hypothetical protein